MDREQFRTWAAGVAEKYHYTVRFESIGTDDPDVGPPTQLALFTRTETTTDTEESHR